ncbi:MAG: hypothetical protein MRY72_10915 [Aquisalinus sp.]|nr:hypothetical protein [Aquisalinus sp.]
MTDQVLNTTETKQTLSSPVEDLAMIRELAEEGRMRPLQGGKYLVMWGLISVVGLTFTGLMVAGKIPLPEYMIMIVWGVLSTGGGIMSGRWGRESADTIDGRSIGNKVEAMVWSIAGVFLFLLSVMLFSLPLYAGDRFEAMGYNPTVLFGLFAPVAFGLYAICLAATAVAGRASWLNTYVICAFIFAGLTLFLIMDYMQFVAAIVGIIATTVIPGLIMIDKNRKAQGMT